MKKIFLVCISILAFFATSKIVYSESEIVGYTLNNDWEESYIYRDELKKSNNLSTKSTINYNLEKNDDVLFTSLSVIGNDDRIKLSESQYKEEPYRSVCRIMIQFDETPEYCSIGTGFLVGPHTILTACHVLYDCDKEHNYGWFNKISISFGTYKNSNGIEINPYGVIKTFKSASCGRYRDTYDTNDDWALLELQESIGNDLGYFGVSAELSKDESIWAVGYSGDLKGCMGYGYGKAFNVKEYKFDHDADTNGGASGGAVVKTSNGLVCGIISSHSYYWLFGNHYTNHACKVSPYIVKWVEERL